MVSLELNRSVTTSSQKKDRNWYPAVTLVFLLVTNGAFWWAVAYGLLHYHILHF